MHTSLPDFDMPNEEQVHLAAESFRLLSDPTRIKILWALLQGESNVACLAELADAAPTAVSQHLAKLRLAGLVKGRREGTFVYYSAADEHVRRLLSEGLFHADHLDRAGHADGTGHAEARLDAPPSGRAVAHARPAR
ncbi:ArsR/SmtB family transcription factor [Streptosporangium sp. NPDC003464]